MLTLLELQRGFARALLEGDETALRGLVAGDGMSVADRIDVYRNNVVSSLSEVLEETYPAVRRLVDPRFFSYAAHEFLTAEPPERPRLAEYGSRFPAFIGAFEACRHLPYLADVARLEWRVHAAAEATEASPVSTATLQAFAPPDTPQLLLDFHPSFGYIASAWPIDRIWEANRGEEPETGDTSCVPIDLGAGGARLEVARAPRGIVLRSLDPATFAFRNALSSRDTLELAAEAALAADPVFDLAASLAALFDAGAIIGARLAKPLPIGDTA